MIYFDFCKIVCKDSRDIMQVQNCFSTTKQLTYGYQVYTDRLAILQLTERERQRERKREREKGRERKRTTTRKISNHST